MYNVKVFDLEFDSVTVDLGYRDPWKIRTAA